MKQVLDYTLRTINDQIKGKIFDWLIEDGDGKSIDKCKIDYLCEVIYYSIDFNSCLILIRIDTKKSFKNYKD